MYDLIRPIIISTFRHRTCKVVIVVAAVFVTLLVVRGGRDTEAPPPLDVSNTLPISTKRPPIEVRKWSPSPTPQLYHSTTGTVRLTMAMNESLVPISIGGKDAPAMVYNNLFHFSNRLYQYQEGSGFTPCEEYSSVDADPAFRYATGPMDVLERAATLTSAILRRTQHSGSWNQTWPESVSSSYMDQHPSTWGMRSKSIVGKCKLLEGWSALPVVDGVSFSKFVANEEALPDQMRILVDNLLFKGSAPNRSNDFSTIGASSSYMCVTALTSPLVSLVPGGDSAPGGGILIDPTSGLLWGPPHEGRRAIPRAGGLRVPVCLVTSGRNEALTIGSDLFGYHLKWNITHSTPLSTPAPLAYFGYIERPQHALQFIFSLLGHISSVYDLCAQMIDRKNPRDIHIYLSVLTYGKFQKHSDTTDFVRYPHIELMALIPFLVERMRDALDGQVHPIGSREQWRRALFSQIRFVHDRITFGAVTTVPSAPSSQEATVLWGQQYLRPGKSPAPVTHMSSIAPNAQREGYLYNAVLIGGPGARLLPLKKYRQNDARITTGSSGAVPLPGPFYLYMTRQLLIDYYGINTRRSREDFHALKDSTIRQYRLLVVSRRLGRRRLILNENAAIKAIILGLVGEEEEGIRIATEADAAHSDFLKSKGELFVVSPGLWQLYTSARVVVTVVDWEQLQFPKGKPKKPHGAVDITTATAPNTIPSMLEVALNTDVMLGMHGNGLCWGCFMSTIRSQTLNPFGGGVMFPSSKSELPSEASKHKYPLMVEVTSDASFKNEVGHGVNVKNVGNLAGTVCPITALSIAGTAVDNPFSRAGPEGHRWKEVDVSLNRHALQKIQTFVTEYRPE